MALRRPVVVCPRCSHQFDAGTRQPHPPLPPGLQSNRPEVAAAALDPPDPLALSLLQRAMQGRVHEAPTWRIEGGTGAPPPPLLLFRGGRPLGRADLAAESRPAPSRRPADSSSSDEDEADARLASAAVSAHTVLGGMV